MNLVRYLIPCEDGCPVQFSSACGTKIGKMVRDSWVQIRAFGGSSQSISVFLILVFRFFLP